MSNYKAELPELPLGLTMRQHLGHYQESLAAYIKLIRETESDLSSLINTTTSKHITSEALNVVHDGLEALLEFVDREARFYGVELGQIKQGQQSVRIRRGVCEQDHPVIRMQLLWGDEELCTTLMHDPKAKEFANAILKALEESPSGKQ